MSATVAFNTAVTTRLSGRLSVIAAPSRPFAKTVLPSTRSIVPARRWVCCCCCAYTGETANAMTRAVAGRIIDLLIVVSSSGCCFSRMNTARRQHITALTQDERCLLPWREVAGRLERRPISQTPAPSLRRGNFLLDLDIRHVERSVGQLRRTSNEDLQARLEVCLAAGDRGGDDGLRRHRDLLHVGLVGRNLVLDREHLAVNAGDRGLRCAVGHEGGRAGRKVPVAVKGIEGKAGGEDAQL